MVGSTKPYRVSFGKDLRGGQQAEPPLISICFLDKSAKYLECPN